MTRSNAASRVGPAPFSHAPGVADGTPLFDMTHLENAFRPPNFALMLILAVLGGGTYWLYQSIYGNRFSETALAAFCWLYFALSVVWASAKTLRPGPRNWLSPDVVFWLVFTMFHVPYVVFYLLDLADYDKASFFSANSANRAMCCVILSAVGFLVGYELGAIGREQPAPFAPAARISAGLFQGSQILFFVMFVVASVVLAIGIGPLLLAHGYAGFRRIERYGVGDETRRVVTLATSLLRIAVTVYVAACIMRYRRASKGLMLPVFMIWIIMFFLLVGARSEVAVVVLPLILGYHYYVRRIRLAIGIPLFCVALISFGAVGVARRADSLSPGALIDAYRTYRERHGANPFVVSLVETGASIKAVNVTCTFVPAVEPYWHGRSLLNSALMIIPSPKAGWRRYVSPAPPLGQWVTFRATGRAGGRQAGWGGSIAAEAYVNFGLAGGAIFMVTVGFMMRRIYDRTLRRPTFLAVCLLLITVTCLALWCRNSSHHFMRPSVWTMIAAWAVWSIAGGSGGGAPAPRFRAPSTRY